ncbi:MAG: SCO family protein [Verrucomicrobiota bacterium]
MKQSSRLVAFFVWGILLAVIVVIVGTFIRGRFRTDEKPLPVYLPLNDFSLTNQLGETVSLSTLRGQIWIADVIFTRCPLQCIRMTKRMRQLQDSSSEYKNVRFVSVTADPQFDTPLVLSNYANAYGAAQSRWSFLTGPKSEINRLVVEGLKLVAYEKKPEERAVPNDLFLHSTKFVLVDGEGNIRGWFDGEKDTTKGEILRALKNLSYEKKL